jgi:hypothetical protein
MSLGAGLFTADEQYHALMLTGRLQPDEDWVTPSGSLVPRGSIADHITLDGKPIFFPGTLDEYEKQGGVWGKRPPLANPYCFVEMAWHLAAGCGRASILAEEVNGLALLERLELAFWVPNAENVHEDTGLMWCDENNRRTSLGFTDSTIHTGELLFASLMRHQAARQMADLHESVGNASRASEYRRLAELISSHLARVFAHPSGLLRASTGKSAQPDVWSSAYAVYIGALSPTEALSVCRALLDAYRRGTISYRGSIRHVPTDADFSDKTAWECTLGCPKNRYQNGAYWGVATGWVVYALAQVDTAAALALASEYIDELQSGDYRKGEEFGSPLECFHPDGDYAQNPVFMTGVTCPLAAFRRLGWV